MNIRVTLKTGRIGTLYDVKMVKVYFGILTIIFPDDYGRHLMAQIPMSIILFIEMTAD